MFLYRAYISDYADVNYVSLVSAAGSAVIFAQNYRHRKGAKGQPKQPVLGCLGFYVSVY